MAPAPLRNYTIVLAIVLAFTAILSSASPAAAQEITLPAPTLTAQANDSAIELSWDAVDGAARYQLATRPRGGEWLYLDNNTLTETTFTHTNPAPATTHAYQVRAVSENGDAGEWSQRVFATFAAALTAPSLSLQPAADTIELSWTTISGAGGYQLIVWSGSGNWQQLGGGDLTGAAYSHAGIAAGTTYYYTVRAVNDSEVGPWSEQVSGSATGSQSAISTPTPTATPAPTLNLTPTPTSTPTQAPAPELTPTSTSTASPLSAPVLSAQAAGGAVKLGWSEVHGAVRYELWFYTQADAQQQLDDGTLTDTAFTHADLDEGVTYHYTVRAVGAAGQVSDWSAWVPVTVTEHQPSTGTPTPSPTPPNGLTATPTPTTETTPAPTPSAPPPPALSLQMTETAVDVRWDAVSGASRYELWVWTNAGGLQRLDNGSLTGTTYTHTELQPDATYHYTARTVNAAGVPSGWSTYVSATIAATNATTASQVFAQVSPSIAFVETKDGSGSGVLIEGGWIVTNAHVVWPSTSVRVVFPDGTAYENLPVRYWDYLADLALLGPVTTPAQYATMADGEHLPIGSPVYLIGYPGEYEEFPQPTMTQGIHSRLRQWEPGPFTFFQSDSTIVPGQSGGALVSASGHVIGISGFRIFGEFGFVTSSADLLPRIRKLLAGQAPSGIGPRLFPRGGGTLRHDLTLNSYWDEQVYVINEPPGTTLRFSLLGQNDGAVTISDALGLRRQTFDVFDITGFEYGAYFLGKFTPHFLTVRQNSTTAGSFILAANHNLVPFNDPDRGKMLRVGHSVYGNIDYPGDTDYFLLDLEEGEEVEILAQSILADMVLTVGLDSPVFSVSNDDSVGLLRRDSRVLFRAPIKARFYVIVRDFFNSAPGGYILTVNR